MRPSLALALLSAVLAGGLSGGLAGCADGGPSGPDDEWGMEGPLSPTPPPGKEDAQNRQGLLVNTDTTRTQVWTARNKWEDTTTPAARAAGLAWPADSGLNWDQKYAAWLKSLRWIPAMDGYGQTVELTTPWGKTLPAPQLECAETSLFLRITFAAWYELPLFFESVDESGKRVYFGHNGVRTATGRYAQSPEFAVAYKDYAKSDWRAAFPHDANLRTKKLWGGEDVQPMIAPGATFGAYLDELHVNKRAGYFTVMALNYLGSVNLADAANAYNLAPDAIRPGDFLIERWQRVGIGHTLVLKDVTDIAGTQTKDVALISGSMPRRQGKQNTGSSAKSYFTSAYMGGPGANAEGDEYVKLGGGAKRFRVAKNIGGYWTNTWMAADEASWINSTDYPRLAARPARFQTLLGEVPPAQLRAELLTRIDEARHHLSQYPASCSARERREQAFAELYALEARTTGRGEASVDAQYRKLEDYVFGELDYAASRTCCWDSSTAAMYEIIMDQARADQAAAEAAQTCAAPIVFKSQADGYKRWADHAAALGRAAEWRPWTEDEACPARAAAMDTEAALEGTPYCELATSGGGACTDALEPNDDRAVARAVTGTVTGLKICAGDVDYLTSARGGVVTIRFTHAQGDLDVLAFDASGTQVGSSAGSSDSETVTVPAGGSIKVFGYQGASNAYTVVAP